jgi:glutamate synthase domain-containing protein 2
MSIDWFDMLKTGLGTLVALLVVIGLFVMFVRDVTQKQHTVLRNFPVVGRFRYWFEELGEYFRQYFFANDREEMPFNRATRSWVYRLAKNEGGIIGFGSTYDLHAPGALIFVNAPFPVLESERLPTPPLTIGEGSCRTPFTRDSLVNISGMSFGAISEPAVRALSRGAKVAGCWMDTGEGGLVAVPPRGRLRRDHADRHGAVRRARRDGQYDLGRIREIAALESVRAFEIKLSQGAKPGKGGVLPGGKVTELIAGSAASRPATTRSARTASDIATMDELLDRIAWLRELTGKPVGIKTAIGGRYFANELAERVLGAASTTRRTSSRRRRRRRQRRGAAGARRPRRTVDRRGAAARRRRDRRRGTEAAREDHRVGQARHVRARGVGDLRRRRLREHRARLHVRPGLHPGAALPHQHLPDRRDDPQPRLQRGLVVEEKYLRVANYANNMNKEIDMIAHSCGVRHARELERRHVRLVQPSGGSVAFDVLFPLPARAAGESA